MTFLDNIFKTINEIRGAKDNFFLHSNISYVDLDSHDSEFITFMGVLKSWGKSSKEQVLSQSILKEHLDRLKEGLKLLQSSLPKDKIELLNESFNKLDSWINMQGDPPNLTSELSKKTFDEELDRVEILFKQFESEIKEIVVFPDTNTLISFPEPKLYLKLIKGAEITIIILPTVISELDKHKIFHKNEEFRTKVGSVIKRIKGYRKQGNILKGIKLENNSIILKMLASDPNFNSMPDWLDKDNNDDRIIAGVLEFQVRNLNSKCYLISGDINMLNKAELAGLKYFDNEDLE